jgi:hypothetical protein
VNTLNTTSLKGTAVAGQAHDHEGFFALSRYEPFTTPKVFRKNRSASADEVIKGSPLASRLKGLTWDASGTRPGPTRDASGVNGHRPG